MIRPQDETPKPVVTIRLPHHPVRVVNIESGETFDPTRKWLVISVGWKGPFRIDEENRENLDLTPEEWTELRLRWDQEHRC